MSRPNTNIAQHPKQVLRVGRKEQETSEAFHPSSTCETLTDFSARRFWEVRNEQYSSLAKRVPKAERRHQRGARPALAIRSRFCPRLRASPADPIARE